MIANGSYPSASDQWSLSYASFGGSISADAVCAQAPDGYVQESGVSGQYPGLVNVTCPGGTVVIGGGGDEGQSSQNAGWNAPISYGPTLASGQWSFGSGALGSPQVVSGWAICAQELPTVSGVSPAAGPLAGGTTVVITGTSLTGATAVTFGSAGPATSFTVNSATQITAITPPGAAGPVDVTVSTAGGTSATGSGDTFTYTAPPPAPTCADVSAAAAADGAGTAVSLACSANVAETYAIVSGPAHGTLGAIDQSTGEVSYTPQTGYTGTDAFTYEASDAGGTSGIATVSITVAPPPAPACQAVSAATANGGGTVTVGLSCSGAAGFPLTYAIVAAPAHGTLGSFDQTAGSLSYLSNPGYSGTDTFSYRATDAGGASNTATATVTIFPSTATPTGTAVECSPASAVVGEQVVCAATVSDTAAGNASTPTGAVSFVSSGAGSFGGGGSCLLSGAGASASCAVTFTPSDLAGGSEAITASYVGDASHGASSGAANVVLVVPKRLTAATVSCSPTTVAVGSTTSCTVTVHDSSGGSPSTPTGTVTVSSGDVGTVSPTVCSLRGGGGSAGCSVSYTPGPGAPSTQTITADYGGDAGHAGVGAFTTVALPAVAGVTVDVSARGNVLVRVPGSGQYVPLKGDTTSVPMGSTIDARKGAVHIATAADDRAASDRRHRLQSGTFSVAIFAIEQQTARQRLAAARRRHLRRVTGVPPTTMVLDTPPGAAARARCRRTGAPGKGVVRTIIATVKGVYRTVGAASTTMAQNARYRVEDRCDGTLTEVARGRVTVVANGHSHPVTVKAGQGYFVPGRFH